MTIQINPPEDAEQLLLDSLKAEREFLFQRLTQLSSALEAIRDLARAAPYNSNLRALVRCGELATQALEEVSAV